MNHARNEAFRPQEIVEVSPAKAEVQRQQASAWTRLKSLFSFGGSKAESAEAAPTGPTQIFALDAKHSLTLPPAYDANPQGKKNVESAMNPNYRIDAILTVPNVYPSQKHPGKTIDLQLPLEGSDNIFIWQQGLPVLHRMNELAAQYHQYGEELGSRKGANEEEMEQLKRDEKNASKSLQKTDETSERGRALVTRLDVMRKRLDFLMSQQAFLKGKEDEMMNQYVQVTKRNARTRSGEKNHTDKVTIAHILHDAQKDMQEFKSMAVSVASKQDPNSAVTRAHMRNILTYWYTNKAALEGLRSPDFKALLQSTPLVAGPVEGDLDEMFAAEDARKTH